MVKIFKTIRIRIISNPPCIVKFQDYLIKCEYIYKLCINDKFMN